MDWFTVLASAALSTVISAVVSLAAVSQTTIRQRRAERRDQARLELAALLAQVRRNVGKYQARMLSSMKRDEPNRIEGDDYVLAGQVLEVAERLHPVRRWLVARRTRRLFGPFIFRIAEISPAQGDSLGAMAPLLFADRSKLNLAERDMRLVERRV